MAREWDGGFETAGQAGAWGAAHANANVDAVHAYAVDTHTLATQCGESVVAVAVVRALLGCLTQSEPRHILPSRLRISVLEDMAEARKRGASAVSIAEESMTLLW